MVLAYGEREENSWVSTEPVDYWNFGFRIICLADPGRLYIIYIPHGGSVTTKLEPGRYEMRWFNPRSGEYLATGFAQGSNWTLSIAPDGEDWVIQLSRSPLEH